MKIIFILHAIDLSVYTTIILAIRRVYLTDKDNQFIANRSEELIERVLDQLCIEKVDEQNGNPVLQYPFSLLELIVSK